MNPRLKSFGGKAKDYSPRARIRSWMGYVVILRKFEHQRSYWFSLCYIYPFSLSFMTDTNYHLTAMTGSLIDVAKMSDM